MNEAHAMWGLIGFIAGFTLAAIGAAKSNRPATSTPNAKPARVEVVTLPPGASGAVLTFPTYLTPEQREAVHKMVKQGLVDGVLVLEGGLQLSAVFVPPKGEVQS
jgi:hypothetical protein